MNETKSKLVEQCLAKLDIHQEWKSTYLTAQNDKFFEQAFDYIARVLNAPKNSTILDVGCGTCAHSIRLANRGFLVQAVDFSESVLKEAEAEVKTNGLEIKISIQCEDILSLPFEDEAFRYILCWGVLMHIPDLEKATAELTRVLKPGGMLVIGENNMYSLESIILPILKRFLRKEKANVMKTPAGMEYWKNASAGALLYREANIQWLIDKFESKRFTVKKHVARQFTELYVKVPSPLLRTLIHGFNNFWFKYVKIPHFAFGNIVILQKEK